MRHRVKGLDGREYKLKLSGRVVTGLGGRASSDNHKAARRLLKELFPYDVVYEEVSLPGCGTELYADFVLVSRGLVVEVQGRQHREMVPYFHKGKSGFAAQQNRDALKRRFCELNGLTLLELNDDDRANWGRVVRNAFLDGDAAGEDGGVGEEDGHDPLRE